MNEAPPGDYFMNASENKLLAITRRFFCCAVASVGTGAFSGVAAHLNLSRTEEAEGYLIVNGWVLTSKDALSRRERL